MSVETFIRIDILTTAKKLYNNPAHKPDGQFKNNYQPRDKDTQGTEVSLTPLLPKNAGKYYTEKITKYFCLINSSCKNSSGFSALHTNKSRSDTPVTRAGLDGWQKWLQMWRDLILEFHIPAILLIGKLLVPRVDPLPYGKQPRCQGA